MGADTSSLRGNASAFQNENLAALSNLTPGYILKLKERFESASEDYNLDRKALKDFFKCRDNEIETLFKLFDTDGNGSIDSYEFVCALSLMSHATLTEKAELIFNLYDFDRSQSISKDELTVLMTNALTAMKFLEGKKAPSITEIEQKTNEFFKAADDDANGVITLKEFKSYIKKDKQILEVLTSYGVAKSEDLGMDFGNGAGSVPDVDSDLELECKPSELEKDTRKDFIKDGEVPRDEFEEEIIPEGDQSMAKVWNPPSWYKQSRREGEAPDATLDLEYIFGYRCHDVRNNLRYTAENKLVFHAAGVAIVMDQKTNTQSHFLGHRDDIHCLAIDPTGEFVATGEIGPKPRLCIWNCKTMKEIHQINAPMTKGIKHVAFSKDGKFLACSDMSDDHQVFVFNWQAPVKAGSVLQPFAQGAGTRAVIMSLGFNDTGDAVVATCIKAVTFFLIKDGKLQAKNGTGWGNSGADTVMCQAVAGNTLFTGNFAGEIISWKGTQIEKKNKSHNSKISSLFASKNGKFLVSGSDDGVVSTWSVSGSAITALKSFDLKLPDIQSLRPSATSVCLSETGENLLIGTRGGEIMEISQQTAKTTTHLRGHYDGELWGLAVHPNLPQIYSWGRDSMLAVWDLKQRRQLKHCKLESGGDAIAFSNSGTYLVLGFLNGTMLVLDKDFKPICKRKDRQGKSIQVIAFSPNDKICAVGGHDQMIMTYDVQNNFKPLKKLKGSSTTIWHMDFTLDSSHLQTHDLYYNMETGKNNPRGSSEFKDETWATWTRTTGWHVKGIYPPGAMSDDINAVDRSPEGQVCATGDDFGLVKIFKYPAVGAGFTKYIGHSSHVTNVKFTRNKSGQQFLVSTGGEDKTIMQWRYNFDNTAAQQSLEIQNDDIPEDLANGVNADPNVEDDEFGEAELDSGDQALATPAWIGQCKAMTPNGFKPDKNAGKQPNNNVELVWAHGFRSFDTRGNLRYDASGNVVFTTAGLGVVQDTQKKVQEFFNLHGNDIVSMAIHPDKDIVATGQMADQALNEAPSKGGKNKMENNKQSKGGKLVTIYIWRASTREVIAKIFGFQRAAVRHLLFSPGGSKLLTIGDEDSKPVAIYNWATQSKLADCQTDPDGVLSTAWKNDDEFATCGAKHLKTYTHNGSSLNGKKSTLGKSSPTSVCYVLDGKLVTGGTKGELTTWNGTSEGKTYKSHEDSIWCIEKCPGKDAKTLFFTGGNDGKVIQWNAQFQPTQTFDVKQFVKLSPGLRSIDVHQDGRLLVGTRGADVLELDKSGKLKQIVVQGHFRGVSGANLEFPETWGCATHPSEQIFASAGADKTIRVWNAKKMIAVSEQLPQDPTALDWSPNGLFIAAGDRNGCLTILDAKTLQVLSTAKTSLSDKKGPWCEVIHWSPDGKFVALGTHGGLSKLEIAEINEQGKISGKVKALNIKISSALTGVDWAQDGESLVITSQAGDLLFFSKDGKMINASANKETQWQTWTCRYGFPVIGLNGAESAKSIVRSHNGLILATGDRDSKLKLYKYPCVAEKPECKEYIGHSSFITKVRFTANDSYIITTGGNDLTTMVWKTDFNEAEEQPTENDQDEVDENDQDQIDPVILAQKNKDAKKQAKDQKHSKLEKPVLEEGEFGEEDLGEGDQFMAIIPWKGQIKPPDGWKRAPKNQNLAPNVSLEIDWIHGYRGNFGPNNIKFMEDDSVAYFAAAVGVAYKSENHTQKYFTKHTDDITSIAFSPDMKTIVTGEMGNKPAVYLWDATTMTQILKIQNASISKSVSKVAFSPSGKLLLVTDNSADQNVSVYDTKTGSQTAVSKKCVGEIAFENETTFVSAGSSGFAQWTINAKSIKSKQGNFGENDKKICGLAFNGNTAITGTVQGNLYLWSGTSIKTVKKLGFTQKVSAIEVTQEHIFVGGKQGIIQVLNKNFDQLFEIKVNGLKESICSHVMAVTLNKRQDKIMVGTYGCELIELPIDLKAKKCDVSKAKFCIQGHYAPMLTWTNEVWGLSVFQGKNRFVTSGDDATLRIWDATAKKQIGLINLDIDKLGEKIPLNPKTKEIAEAAQGKSVSISPKDDFIAVGMKDGSVKIYELATQKLIAIQKCGNEWIEDLKFSPDGSKLVVGGHDNYLQIFSVPEFKLLGKRFKVGSSFITHVDWSQDGNSLRTTDGAYELLYYDANSGVQNKNGATDLRGEIWATHSVVFSFQAQGIWQAGQDGTDINMVDRSNKPIVDNMQLIATADDAGKVNLYRYPSVDEKSKAVQGHGHSSHVTKVRFNYNDSLLISTGGNDQTVFQWKIVTNKK